MILTVTSLPMIVEMLRCERKRKKMLVRVTDAKGTISKTVGTVRREKGKEKCGQRLRRGLLP